MSTKNQDVEKKRYWQGTIREAARSGLSIREFCRQHRLPESQFYRWRRKLEQGRQQRRMRKPGVARGSASFALVSEEPGTMGAGIELVLGNGRRLRIGQGVDEETLRAVLAALEREGC